MGEDVSKGRVGALMSNTIVFAVGNALTKLIQLVLMPLYTTYMSVDEYGVAELVNNMSDLLYPLLCLCIFEAVFRFAMERDVDKGELLAGALGLLLVTVPVGFLITGVVCWAFSYDLAWACLALVVAVSLRTVLAQFARGIGEVRVFAVSGVLNTLLLLVCGVAFLVFLQWGVPGYVGALLLGNVGSCLYLIVACRLWMYAGARPNVSLLKDMLVYSLPLLPNTLAWWFINIFGRYVLLFFQGPAAAGLYTAASKLPSLVSFLSTIFQQAWQISAAQELNSDDGVEYFSKVFSAFLVFLCCGCSVLITLSMPLSAVLLRGEFFEGWRFVPLLMLAALIGCVSAFFGTFYNAAKRTGAVLVSTAIGAVANIALALALVGVLGIWGVLVASVVGQALTLAYRMVDSRKFAPITYDAKGQCLLILVLVLQTAAVSLLKSYAGIAVSAGLTLVILICCGRKYGHVAMSLAKSLIGSRIGK